MTTARPRTRTSRRRRWAPALVALVSLLAVIVGSQGNRSNTVSADGPVAQSAWTTSAAVGGSPIAGAAVPLTITVVPSAAATVLIDVEIYDRAGRQVQQWYVDEQAFQARVARRFSLTWNVSARLSGEYVVKVGVFSRGWGELYHWNDRAAVTTVAPSVTTVPGATTTVPRATTTTMAPRVTTTTAPRATTTTTLPRATTTTAPRVTTTTTLPRATTTTLPRATTTTLPRATTTTLPRATTTTAPRATTTTTPGDPTGRLFSATFDTAGSFYDNFQLSAHFRDVGMGNGANVAWGTPISGDHDMSCGNPASQRVITAQQAIDGTPGADLRRSGLFWWCGPSAANPNMSGHVMTGMGNIDGYTILSFSPNRSFTNVRSVCWEVNLTNLGGRKWTQALVIPESAYRANGGRLDYISPVTQEVDETALPLPPGSFLFQNWDHAFRLYNPAEVLVDSETFSTSDKGARYQHCMVDNGDGTVTVTQERDGGYVHTRTVPGSFPDQARVIFQDDNYTPGKDEPPLPGFTWHWDNIAID